MIVNNQFPLLPMLLDNFPTIESRFVAFGLSFYSP